MAATRFPGPIGVDDYANQSRTNGILQNSTGWHGAKRASTHRVKSRLETKIAYELQEGSDGPTEDGYYWPLPGYHHLNRKDPHSGEGNPRWRGRRTRRNGSFYYHSGIDIKAPSGANVVAIYDGVVVHIWPKPNTSNRQMRNAPVRAGRGLPRNRRRALIRQKAEKAKDLRELEQPWSVTERYQADMLRHKEGEDKIYQFNRSHKYGFEIIIRHRKRLYSQYAHLSHIAVDVGDHVMGGEVIGNVGRSGNTPDRGDAHLHFEVRRSIRGGKHDPYLYVPNRGMPHR